MAAIERRCTVARFKDNKEREWEVPLTVGDAMRLKKDGVDIYALAENKFAKLIALETDDFGFLELLAAILKPQLDAKQVSVDDFYFAMGGQSMYDAWEAFGSAYLGFTREPEMRSSLKSLFDKHKKLKQVAGRKMAEAMTRMEKIALEEAEKFTISDDQIRNKMKLDLSELNLNAQSSALPVS